MPNKTLLLLYYFTTALLPAGAPSRQRCQIKLYYCFTTLLLLCYLQARPVVSDAFLPDYRMDRRHVQYLYKA
jgi:hypothetical protein